MDIPHFVYRTSVGWCLEFFCFLATVNNIAVNICIQGFMWVDVSISPGCVSKSRIAGSSGNSVSYFEELPNSFFKTPALTKMYESFHFPQAHQQNVVSNFFTFARLISEKKNLTVVFNLNFLYYEKNWATFQRFQGHLVFFRIQICPLWYEIQIFSPLILYLCLWGACVLLFTMRIFFYEVKWNMWISF